MTPPLPAGVALRNEYNAAPPSAASPPPPPPAPPWMTK